MAYGMAGGEKPPVAAESDDMGEMPMDDVGPASSPGGGEGYESDEAAAIAEAFPELAGSPDRIASLQTAIKMCVQAALDERDGLNGPKSEPPPGGMPRGKGGKAKAPAALVLAFGPSKAKKG